jgi:menaquinol-cytochrome c reductase iron-sulfur subunit
MQRRTFLKTLAAGVNGLLGLAVVIPGIRFLLDPLRRASRDRGFIRVAPLTSLNAGRPTQATVLADRWDAYVHHPPGPIGHVWLLRGDKDDRDPKVRCLHVICPHLGCAIDYTADRNAFHCPCHASEFDPEGRRRLGPSPRDMDELECRISEPDDRGERWVEVKYQEFQTGVPDKRSTA